MARRKISQREARRTLKAYNMLLRETQSRHNMWTRDYPGGANVATLGELPDRIDGILYASSKMGCAIIGKWDETNKKLLIFAVKP